MFNRMSMRTYNETGLPVVQAHTTDVNINVSKHRHPFTDVTLFSLCDWNSTSHRLSLQSYEPSASATETILPLSSSP